MNKSLFVSIIIPIYNAEKFLSICINSILSQTFKNFELLLIDDGSPDNSGKICDEYAKKDSRIRVFHKKNEGPSITRNFGIIQAHGEWISFIDSDDSVDENFLLNLVNGIKNDEYDIVTCDFIMNTQSSNDYYKLNFCEDKTEFIKKYLNFDLTVMWNMLIRRKIFLEYNILIPTHISYCEDLPFTVELYLRSRRIGYINKALYFYNRCNISSLSHNLTCGKWKQYMDAIKELHKILTINEVFEIYHKEFYWRVLQCKREMIISSQMYKDFNKYYPESNKYIKSCPYINKKIKFMMWCKLNNLGCITRFIILLRTLFNR